MFVLSTEEASVLEGLFHRIKHPPTDTPTASEHNQISKAKLGHHYNLLTTREKQVFKLLALGVHVKHIATKLDLMPKTVSVHRTNIYKKLGARTSIDLLRVGLAAEVLDLEMIMDFDNQWRNPAQ